MKLQLRNIGMIEEADVSIDGLTVIAGENDTGKSTVGKALFLSLASHHIHGHPLKYAQMVELLFGSFITYSDGRITLSEDNKKFEAEFSNNNQAPFMLNPEFSKYDVSMIETPIIWNFFRFFNAIEKVKTEASFFDQDYDIPYPYLTWDIYKKLSLPKKEENLKDKKELLLELENIINGKFTKDDFGDFLFVRDEKKIPIINTATGIKQFGILQKLIENNYIHEKSVIILDEPEVHLHPKWQLKMAQLIVALVKNGVKILVNSHSPYMIEALQRYAEQEKIRSDFYLAEHGKIGKIENSNSQTLSKIFEKLSEPFEQFEEMDSQKMENLING